MVTIPEGRWKSEVFAILAKASGKPVADYEAAAKDATALGLPASAKGNVEGYLFPATYEFAKDSTPTEQLRQMVQKAVSTLTAQGVAPDDMEKVIITASILEAEGRSTEDREKQARVILNRHREGHEPPAGLDGQLRRPEAGRDHHRRGAGRQEPVQHLRQRGSAGRADRQPERVGDRGGRCIPPTARGCSG